MGCFQFLKIMMFCFNGIIFLGGAAVLGVGIWLKVDGGSFIDFLGHLAPQLKQMMNVGYLCIALGGALVLIGFLGCCGAMKENKCMLMIFFIIILLIFIAQITGAVVVLAFSGLAEIFIGYIKVWAVKSIKEEFGKNADITAVWHAVMEEFKCCGFNDYSDFRNSPFYNDTSSYPKECCLTSVKCYSQNINPSLPGCFKAFLKLLKDNTKIVGAVALGICVLEMGALTASMIMYYQIKKREAHV
ncbi:tetraspanin-1-like [Heptranchias perlo]|uniref:tetraspanin-1-like n=1 Tax=Heptranchias perlo TaxID=212740 RepID=UPI003559F8AF